MIPGHGTQQQVPGRHRQRGEGSGREGKGDHLRHVHRTPCQDQGQRQQWQGCEQMHQRQQAAGIPPVGEHAERNHQQQDRQLQGHLRQPELLRSRIEFGDHQPGKQHGNGPAGQPETGQAAEIALKGGPPQERG
ncbi:MAG: hypothetical protein U5R48_18730 [Gammaproteobacteria bacterium]|nr:hypothetical protein [Gammaproteobacteria bacterium]